MCAISRENLIIMAMSMGSLISTLLFVVAIMCVKQHLHRVRDSTTIIGTLERRRLDDSTTIDTKTALPPPLYA